MSHSSQFRPRRELGRTGFRATIFGIGDLADRSVPIETCVATARRALDAGLNAIDTAPNYEDGYSEEVVGRAVRDVARDQVFVIDKVDHHDAPVGPQVEESLGRLGLAFTDLFVFHNLSSPEVFDCLCHPNGGFDQLADAVHAGKCRFRGISSHSSLLKNLHPPEITLEFLGNFEGVFAPNGVFQQAASPEILRAALLAGVCDVVMFPVGPFVDSRYVTDILPLAKSLGVGTVCFKTFGAGKLVGDKIGYNQPLQQRLRGKMSSGGTDHRDAVLPRLTVAECLRYTLTLDPDVALLGLSYPNEQDAAFAAAHSFLPLSDVEMVDIRRRAIEARQGKGPCWWNPDPEA